ncbi:enterochelin esterase [Streptomyces californicus]|uniref:enterochelin esterase n=1 Tax=Streptomyces californicus TaxID=67351 RepID=UPI001E3F8315|nr:enterochelin esterase [Streptomyces californicus]MCC0576123.1 enterochelin esterase [Streptomyces californicus]
MTYPPRRNPPPPPPVSAEALSAGPAAPEEPAVRSPLLRMLLADVRAGDPGAEEAFWRYAAATGTPLVEPDPEGDPDHRLVTFVRREEPSRPATHVLALVHTVTDKDRHAGDLAPHLMERIEGTGVWAISHRLRADHRASYQFHATDGSREDALRADRAAWLQVLDRAEPDPLNTRVPLPSRDGRNPASVLELPDSPPQSRIARRDGTERGRTLDAEVDGRRITVHLPPGHRRDGRPYALAVLLDGEMWGPVLGVGDILDNLHADGELPPTVAVLVDTMGRRMDDLACSGPFVDWLADTLLPWAEREYGAGADTARTAIAGQSAGGLTAAFAAFRRPDRFGLALSQSGSFWWPDDERGGEWLTGQYAWAERRPVTLRLEVGLQEWMLLGENRRLRNVLRARGYDVRYGEFNGGHDYACWRGGLADGLVDLLGGR